MKNFFQGMGLHTATDPHSSMSVTSFKRMFACLLAAVSFNAFAADQSVTITTNPILPGANTFNSLALPGNGVLSGGSDVISFVGLAPGKYDISIGIIGQNVSFNSLTSNLNGVLGAAATIGKFSVFGIQTVGFGPFTLNLFGTAGVTPIYSGNVTVTAVPEPESILMMLVGLAIVGSIAKRRRAETEQPSLGSLA